jgi:hypothetical protein
VVHRINCSVHVIRNKDDYLKPFEQPERNIRNQILQIQSSTTKQIFASAKTLFFNQQKSSKTQSIQALCSYLKENWFSKNKTGWYEGYSVGLPSHSYALKSFHLHSIKRKKYIVSRLPTLKYLKSLETVVHNWSLDRAETLFSVETNSMIPNHRIQIK